MQTKQPPIELLALPIESFQSKSLNYDSFNVTYKEGGWQVKAYSTSEQLTASAALKIYAHSGSASAVCGGVQARHAIRALALESTVQLPGTHFSLCLPSTLFDEKKQTFKETRAIALFHQVASLGYKQLLLGNWTEQTTKLDSHLKAKELLQQLHKIASSYHIDLFIKLSFHSETLASPIHDKTSWQTFLENSIEQFNAFDTPVSVLWPSIWNQEAIDAAIVGYDTDPSSLMSHELSSIDKLKAKTVWYMVPTISHGCQQSFIDLLPHLPKNCSLLFNATNDEKSFAIGSFHPLFDFCSLQRQKPLHCLLPFLDISSWLFGKGLYPIHWPLLLHTFLQNVEAAQMRGAIFLIPSMPQPQSWLWGSLWAIAQKLWGSRLTPSQLLTLWSKALSDSNSEQTTTQTTTQLTSCAVAIASLFASDAAHTTKKSHYEALLDTLETLTPSTVNSLTLSEKSLLFACQEMRRLTFYLAQKAKLNFNAQHKESDLEEGLFSSMSVSQSISKISLIEIHPQPSQPIPNRCYYDVWLKANHYWEHVV